METRLNQHIELLIKRYPKLELAKDSIIAAYNIMEECYNHSGKLLIAGNGGSAADAEHIVGELMKGFEKSRKLSGEYRKKLELIDKELGVILGDNLQGSLPAIALDGHFALTTAYMNDCEPLLCFAQQVNGFGMPGDVFWAISTSGNSKNVIYAAIVAKARKMKVVALTGSRDSELSEIADVTIRSSETRTYMVQEQHLPIYHCLCQMLEDNFFGE